MRRDFQTERQEARPKAAHITEVLRVLGIAHMPIDVERAGLLAQVKSPEGVQIGDLISLRDKSAGAILEHVRRVLATDIARRALASVLKRGGHLIHFTPIIAPSQSTANWMGEISFDGDSARYAIIGEYIVPDAAAPLGWMRDYRLYQAKTDRRCDVLGCGLNWYERKITSHGHYVHLCQRHRAENANIVFARMQQGPGRSHCS